MKKALFIILSVALIVCGTVAGTLAWLTDKTGEVKNTFTVGDINIELKETTGETYKMVPGIELEKNPTVTVKAGSEACWLFVKVDKSTNFDNFMTFGMADGWKPLDGVAGVYYREVGDKSAEGTTDESFAVISGNKVTVKTEVTKEMLTAKDFANPTLTFTAYAIQSAGFTTAAAAWAEASK